MHIIKFDLPITSSIVIGDVPNWLQWAYWLSPIPYTTSSLAVNEMLAPRWMNKLVCNPDDSSHYFVRQAFIYTAY